MRDLLTEPLLDTEDVARLLKVDVTQVYRLVQSKTLPALQIGARAHGGLRFYPADVRRVLNQWREIGASRWESRGGR